MADEAPPRVIDAGCCVVGGGPAGMMAGLLFARAGVSTVVIEKHADFLRDFRGDTVHPSTLTVMKELGLLEAFLERPHQRLRRAFADFGGEIYEVASFDGLDVPCPFIAFMPQWEFLDFLADHARTLPTFDLRMRTEGLSLLWADGRVTGVRARGPDGPLVIRAGLTVAADGRRSALRDAATLRVTDVGAPIDVLWFRLGKREESREAALFHAGAGGVLVTIDRGDYWQCAFVIPKGGADRLRSDGLDAFRARVGAIAPRFGTAMAEIADWDEVKLLTVAVDRLEEWHRPGLLLIGDAAHAMSPIGGVGINLAVQDAVAAANLLAGKLAAGRLEDADLAGVARRRLWPVRATQFMQVLIQNRVLAPILGGRARQPRPPLLLRLLLRTAAFRRTFARLLAVGVRPEHVRSAEAVRPSLRPLSTAEPSG